MKAKRVIRSAPGRLALLTFGAGLWLVNATPAAGGPDDDGVPSGVVAFFAGGKCPMGWVVAAGAQGRLVVGVVDGASAGAQVGTPLGDQEDRKHQHAYSGSV